MPDALSLSVLHAGYKELTVMRSLLNLAGSEPSWQVIDHPGGDFIIVDVDSSDGLAEWQSMSDAGVRVIALTRQRNFKADLQLRKPLRSRQFLDLLTCLPDGGPVPETDSVVTKAVPRWERLELAEDQGLFTLAEHLRRSTWRLPVMLIVQGWPEFIIDPGSGTWFYDGAISDMSPTMFSQTIPESSALPLGSEELVTRCQGMSQRSLSELKWYAGLAQSRGKLHPDLDGDYQFMLTQVPAYAGDSDRYQRLAQLLIRGPISINELHDHSGESTETVACFLNASYTAGRLLINQAARAASF